MTSYVYKLTNIINDKVYIGKSHNPEHRFKEHKRSAIAGADTILHRAIRKYGADSFTLSIIREGTDEEVSSYEIEEIKNHDCCVLTGSDKGYNMTEGGDGFTSESTKVFMKKITDEGRNAFSKGNSGWKAAGDFQRAMVSNGTHHLQGAEAGTRVSLNQRRLVTEGKHHLQGESGSKRSKAVQKKRLEEGTFHMHQPEMKEHQRQKTLDHIAAGTHNSCAILTCPKCGESGKGSVMKRWHFDNCGRTATKYHNGLENITVWSGDVVPDGFVKGMLPRKRND